MEFIYKWIHIPSKKEGFDSLKFISKTEFLERLIQFNFDGNGDFIYFPVRDSQKNQKFFKENN